MREKILRILQKNSRLSNADIAAMTGLSEQEVADEIKELEDRKIINGYQPIVNWEDFDEDTVTAIIGVKISPIRGQGFDRIAERISRFEEVDSVVLISGSSSDLLLTIEGNSMKDISQFVYDKIAPMESVVSTATYFVMKKYKDHKILFTEEQGVDERIQVMP